MTFLLHNFQQIQLRTSLFISLMVSMVLSACGSLPVVPARVFDISHPVPEISSIHTPGTNRLVCIAQKTASLPLLYRVAVGTVSNNMPTSDVPLPSTLVPYVKTSLAKLTSPIMVVDVSETAGFIPRMQSFDTVSPELAAKLPLNLSAQPSFVISGAITHVQTIKEAGIGADIIFSGSKSRKVTEMSGYLEAISPTDRTLLAAPQHQKTRFDETGKAGALFVHTKDQFLHAEINVTSRVSTGDALQFLFDNMVADLVAEFVSNNYAVDFSACGLEEVLNNLPDVLEQPADNPIKIVFYRAPGDIRKVCVSGFSHSVANTRPSNRTHMVEISVLRGGNQQGKTYRKIFDDSNREKPICLWDYRFDSGDSIKAVFRNQANTIIASAQNPGVTIPISGLPNL